MNINDIVMKSTQDHIMANTWRLIFERTSRPGHNQTLSGARFFGTGRAVARI